MPSTAPKIATWTIAPMSAKVRARLDRLAQLDDIEQIAVFPDVHLAGDFCVGTAVATRSLIFPTLIGSDLGCGMATVRLNMSAQRIRADKVSSRLRDLICRIVPILRHPRPVHHQFPSSIAAAELSDLRLSKVAARDGRIQLGTLGRGNHFIELQVDEEDSIWILVHSGSRGMGQAISRFHSGRCRVESGLPSLDARDKAGSDFLNDAGWAVRYASENRQQMIWTVAEIMRQIWKVDVEASTFVDSIHNDVRKEVHENVPLWVHRKGAQRAHLGVHGIIPGSMGTSTYHTIGRGNTESLCSSSHGAGRKLSRTEARKQLTVHRMRRDMRGIAFASDRAVSFIDESPLAYNDIHQVVRAQRSLVQVSRRLEPLVNVKG